MPRFPPAAAAQSAGRGRPARPRPPRLRISRPRPDARSGGQTRGAPIVTNLCRLGAESLARLAHEGYRLREDDADRIADLHRLLVARAFEVEAVDRGDGEVDGELDRVVGPGDLLRALHLLGHLGQPLAQVIGVTEHSEAAFHSLRS